MAFGRGRDDLASGGELSPYTTYLGTEPGGTGGLEGDSSCCVQSVRTAGTVTSSKANVSLLNHWNTREVVWRPWGSSGYSQTQQGWELRGSGSPYEQSKTVFCPNLSFYTYDMKHARPWSFGGIKMYLEQNAQSREFFSFLSFFF